jgi:hypothetical protein
MSLAELTGRVLSLQGRNLAPAVTTSSRPKDAR